MRASIACLTAQDGSCLAELLLDKGYEGHGLVRRSSVEKFDRPGRTVDRLQLVEWAFSTAGFDWREHVEIDPRLIRPAEADYLCGNAALAREKLGGEPPAGFEVFIRARRSRC